MRVERIVKRRTLKTKVKQADIAMKMGIQIGQVQERNRITQAAHGLSYGEGYLVQAIEGV